MFDVIIAANGKSVRAGTDKLSSFLGDSTVLSRAINAFYGVKNIDKIILVSDLPYDFPGVMRVCGGATRAESVEKGLLSCDAEYVLIHDGARPFLTRDLIEKIMEDTVRYGSSVPYTPVTDSLRLWKNGVVTTVDRNDYICLQTPQGYKREDIARAYTLKSDADLSFDDSELYAKYVSPVHLTEGEQTNKKITSPSDLAGYNVRFGSGFDVHAFKDNGKKLILGGVCIPYSVGLEAHSDGDVVVHAIMDALLSAADERDIGVLFPDDDPQYKGADSLVLLQKVKAILVRKNVLVNNLSVTIIAQEPKMKNHIPAMREKISSVLSLSPSQINVTATTTEHLGIVGEKKAIAVLAIASVY